MSTSGILTIDCQAIAKNWLLLSDRMAGSGECAAVVKANAYGLGVEGVAKTLELAGCQAFFVSTLAEAKELRGYIAEASQVFVLGGLSHDLTAGGCAQDWGDLNLIPILYRASDIVRWGHFCRQEGRSLSSAIKVDTGMHRLGLPVVEFEELLQEPSDLLACNPVLVMSHFACADEPTHPLNRQQLSAFNVLSRKVRAAIPNVVLSLSNSSGVFLSDHFNEDTSFDLARPGSALYGINPLPGHANPMNSVVRLQLPVMQIKTIPCGDSVGYGGSFIAARETRIAVVFGGYADGLLRALSGSGFAYFKGQKIPLIGRVSMDSMIFDITDVLAEGMAGGESTQYVDVIGEEQSVDELAAMAGTIAYEMLTSLGARYKRHYIHASSVDEV